MKTRLAILVVLLVVACLTAPSAARAQTTKVSAVKEGWWHVSSTWSPPGVPTLSDTVIVQAGHRIHVQYWANGRVIINNGIIDHPLGHITSDKRVRILLMVGAVDSLINNGGIYGYNARGGSSHPSEPCPPSVLLTCTGGDPVVWPPDRPTGRIRNNGTIRAGDAFSKGTMWGLTFKTPGGMVIARGRPRFYWGLYPDVRLANTGEISGGRGRGSSWIGMGGGTLIGLSPFWWHRPISRIDNAGVIQGGKNGPMGGWTWLATWYPLTAPPGPTGGVIDSGGGRVLGGENVTPSWISWAGADTIVFSGPGSAHAGSRINWMSSLGWPWESESIRLTSLDPDAVHAPVQPVFPEFGGIIWWSTVSTDVRGNPAGTTVIRADPGSTYGGAIYPWTRNLSADPDVTLPDITSPPTDPLWQLREPKPASRDTGDYDPQLLVVPSDGLYNLALYDSTITYPQYSNMGSPGDTASVFAYIASNQPLDWDIEVTAMDSIGFPILNAFQTVRNDTIPLSTVRVDVFIPPGTPPGTRERIDITATYAADPSVTHEAAMDVYVIPASNVVAPYAHDGFFIPEDGGAREDSVAFEFVARNEGRIAGPFNFTAASSTFDARIERPSMWMEAKSESVNTVWVRVPPGTEVGTTDRVTISSDDGMGNPDYPDDSFFDVTYVGETGIDDAELGRVTLSQNVPNPFNPHTEIRFTLPVAGRVVLDVFDVAGRHVRTLVHEEAMQAGEHVVPWAGLDDDGQELASGVYFYRLKTAGERVVRKMVLLK